MADKKRNIKYINRDFSSFKNSLIEFSKTYFPDTYSDFTDTSTGMMFIEMASYIGDVLSLYTDNQIQENFIHLARQTENLYQLAYTLGYKPKVTTAASVELEIFQQLPAILSGSTTIPDYSYCLKISQNTQITQNNNGSVKFLIGDPIDFSFSSSLDPTEISVYSIQSSQPTYYLLKKKRKAISATIKSTTFTFSSPEKFATRDITDSNIIGILDITDSDGNTWYEVPNLAQDTIYDIIPNISPNDPNYTTDSDAPNLLRLKQIQRRFTSRFLNKTKLRIQFGAGNTNVNDEEILPNPDNVGLGLPFEKDKMTTAFSPTNFVFTNTYGISPYNTTLTVRYLTGGGLSSNVPANTLTGIDGGINFINPSISNSTLANTIYSSIAVNNPEAADGGQDGDTPEEIRQNALGNFQNQLRSVTPQDYLIRALSMPSNLGTIAKAFITPTTVGDYKLGEMPSILDLYVLSYNANKQLRTASDLIKNNLKTYLSEYRMINDKIRIKDAYIIDIGVEFDILVYPNYNSNEILTKCISSISEYFEIDKWDINKPIILKELYILLDKIEGVMTVKNVKIINKTGVGYSSYAYDIEGATINNVVYPSIDPMIFQLLNPSTDIKGRISNL